MLKETRISVKKHVVQHFVMAAILDLLTTVQIITTFYYTIILTIIKDKGEDKILYQLKTRMW